MKGNIFLVGLMGAGKTTVGRALARKLGLRFVDSDHEIEARTGATIPWIFEIEGEGSFRRREADVIADLTEQEDIVLATGGGAVLNSASREFLKTRGTVIYLRASVNSILHRTSHDKSRPLLQTADPRARLEELMAEREPLYREVSHLIIDTGRPNIHSMVYSIMAQLGHINRDRTIADRVEKNISPDQPMAKQQISISQLRVNLGDRTYPIFIGENLLDDSKRILQYIQGERVAIITDSTVGAIYLDQLQKLLTSGGKQVISIMLPDGEEAKSWYSLMHIFDVLLAQKCDRKTVLIALGGGVVGDLTGFAAASYMRGVPFIQIPTTLLAQVDSSVGGKTGINHPLGKNMIGAFYQPQAVFADTSTLNTLPSGQLSAGLAEMIKHGAIIDTNYFNWIENNIGKLLAKDKAALAYAIHRSCEIKADVVRQDEREGGLRAILNFGHTFGHAIEAGVGYGRWLHGEAVGCGMVMAADLSWRLGFIDFVAKTRIKALVEAAGLPVRPPIFEISLWLDLMAIDKKNDSGQTKFILLKPLGVAIVTSVVEDALIATLTASTA